jgi:hypothetical protein
MAGIQHTELSSFTMPVLNTQKKSNQNHQLTHYPHSPTHKWLPLGGIGLPPDQQQDIFSLCR